MTIVPVLVLEGQGEVCDCGNAPASFKDKVGGLWCWKCMAKFPFCWREVHEESDLYKKIDLENELENA